MRVSPLLRMGRHATSLAAVALVAMHATCQSGRSTLRAGRAGIDIVAPRLVAQCSTGMGPRLWGGGLRLRGAGDNEGFEERYDGEWSDEELERPLPSSGEDEEEYKSDTSERDVRKDRKEIEVPKKGKAKKKGGKVAPPLMPSAKSPCPYLFATVNHMLRK